MNIKWNGPFYSTFSFGEVCRNYTMALDNIGIRINVQSVHDFMTNYFDLDPVLKNRIKSLQRRKLAVPYINITFEWPMNAIKEAGAEKNIAFFPFEHELCDKSWVDSSIGFDEYWVPSHYNYVGAARSGFEPSKLFIIPHGVEIERFHPSVKPFQTPENKRFTFLAISQYSFRKGWDLLIKAFTSEFSSQDNVCLICKTSHSMSLFDAMKPYITKPNAPQILILNKPLNNDEIPGLYTAADCFVLPVRAEGWGMCFLEAMASGLPTIGTRFSGNLEFMNDKNSLLVEVKELRPDPDHQMMGKPFNYAEPDLADLRYKLRLAYENHDLMSQLRNECLKTAERYTWIKQAERIRDRCYHFLGSEYHPDWKFELMNSSTIVKSQQDPVLDVILFSNDNSYLLIRTLIKWAQNKCPCRINLIDYGHNSLSDKFKQTVFSKGMINKYVRLDDYYSIEDAMREILSDSNCRYVHLGSFEMYPTDDLSIMRIISHLESNLGIAAAGGYIVSPYNTIILGPFMNNSFKLDRTYINKGIRTKQFPTQLKKIYDSKYIHHQSMVLRRDVLKELHQLPWHLRGLDYSRELSIQIRSGGKKLIIDGSFLIVSHKMPDSILTTISEGENVEDKVG